MTQDLASPFHAGEREIQQRIGARDQVENTGRRFVRDYLPAEHRQFYAQLPWLFVGSVDGSGRPWASVLFGRPGFLSSPDRHRLAVTGRPVFGDPLNENLTLGAQLGLLGIDLSTRRRNRLNGIVSNLEPGCFRIAVAQTFGNCPQYIQAREHVVLPGIERLAEPRPVQKFQRFDARARDIVSRADTFYIATNLAQSADHGPSGGDISHRGGKPGFVRVDAGGVLTVPDFAGNRFFNTLGNILLNPRAGLLFIDFQNGDLLSVTGIAEIIWDGPELRAFRGAERLLRFSLDEGILIERIVPMHWRFAEWSPNLDRTGSWEEVRSRLDAVAMDGEYHEYVVTRIERESEVVTSYYLEPEAGSPLFPHRAGQFLPIEVRLPDDETPVRRTYTISSVPNGRWYRLSIKREAPTHSNLPPGIVSNYFHDHVRIGTRIRATSPRGKFTLPESGNRPIVLLSGGVGVTPMIAMLEELAGCGHGCGPSHPVWFIHGARNGRSHAFGGIVRRLAAADPRIKVHIRYSQPAEHDLEAQDYDSVGHVDAKLLRTLLPVDDCEYYLCGPRAFMESLYTVLKELDVSDARIHYELFSPGSALSHEPHATRLSADAVSADGPVPVRFARSGTLAMWHPSRGSLLDLAEQQGLRPDYSCRSGVCGTCETAVLAGETGYTEPVIAPPGEGRVLICCAYPKQSAGEVVLDL